MVVGRGNMCRGMDVTVHTHPVLRPPQCLQHLVDPPLGICSALEGREGGGGGAG